MSHAEQVATVKKALDLSVEISRKQSKLDELKDEKFRAMPQAPVRQLVPKQYPKVNTKYKRVDWIITVLPAILFLLYSIVSAVKEDGISMETTFASLTVYTLTSLFILVAWAVLYFIYRFMYYQFIGKKRIENSRAYKEKCAAVDRDVAQKQSVIDEKYLQEKRHYDKVIVPQYQEELSKWRAMQSGRIAEVEAELNPLKAELQSLYETSKIVPVQYRSKAVLRYLYDTMSTSDYDIKDAIELYDRKKQREVEEARLREQRRQAEAMAEASARAQYDSPAYGGEPSGGGLLRHAVNAALDPNKPKKPSPYKDFMGAVGCQYGKKGYCLGCRLYHQCSRGAGGMMR